MCIFIQILRTENPHQLLKVLSSRATETTFAKPTKGKPQIPSSPLPHSTGEGPN
jgi:hypothetical protein